MSSEETTDHRGGLRIKCPHCHNPIELVAESPEQDVHCPSCGSSFHLSADRAHAWPKGKLPTLGQFELLGAVGRGAFGTVYKARDTQLQRIVAVKVPRSGQLLTDDEEDRFIREARNTAQLQHAGIVSVFEVGRSETVPYIVSEFVEGITLAELVADRRLGFRDSARLVAQVAAAIQHAHNHGVVHRDLKPSNIMITPEGKPRVMDFGLAKRDAGEITMTVEGQVLGTPAYMSPEQASGQGYRVDGRSDVYSLGVILFELLTGEKPFRGTSRMLLNQVLHDDAPSPRKLNIAIPHDLETICLKCLEKEPSRRYQQAGDLAEELERFTRGEPINARPISSAERAWRWCKRRPLVAGLAGTAGLLLGAVAAVASVGYLSTSRALAQAELNEREATRQREEAVKQQLLAQDSSNTSNRHLYLARMRLARQAWEKAEIAPMKDLLKPYDLASDQRRLRGWEWFYLLSLCHRDLATFTGHQGVVNAVSWSSNGEQIASAGDDKTIRIWDVQTGRNVVTLQGIPLRVACIAFAPDGTRLASGGGAILESSELMIWDTASGERLLTLSGHKGNIFGLAWSPDGEKVATASLDNSVAIWNASTGELLFSLKRKGTDNGPVYAVAWSPDGQRLTSSYYEGTVTLWDATTGKQILTFGTRFDPTSPKPLGDLAVGRNQHERIVKSLMWSPDGKQLATASGDYTVKIWDSSSGVEIVTLRRHEGPVQDVRWSKNGDKLATACADGIVRVWSTSNWQEEQALRGHAGGVESVSWSPDDKRIASAGQDESVKVWDSTLPQECLVLRGHLGAVAAVAWHPDGERLASSSADRTVKIWNSRSGTEELAMQQVAGSLAWHPTDKHLLAWANASGENTIKMWNVANNKETQSLSHEKLPMRFVGAVRWSPDGERLASASSDKTLKLWDTKSGKQLYSIKLPVPVGHSLCWNPNGQQLASADQKGKLTIWESASGKEILTAPVHQGAVYALAWDPNGRQLAFACQDGAITICESATGNTRMTLNGHVGPAWFVAWSADGRRVASAGSDSTVRIWETTDGQEVITLRGHAATVSCVAWSPEGDRLASAALDGTIRIWDAATGYRREHNKRQIGFVQPALK